jgi:hypothetical protein
VKPQGPVVGGTFVTAKILGSTRRRERDATLETRLQRGDERTDILHEQLGLLQGGEVSPAVELRPVHDLVRLLGEAPDGEVVREHGDARGNARRLLR